MIFLAVLTVLVLVALLFFIVKNINEKPPVVVSQQNDTSSNENLPVKGTPEPVYAASFTGVDAVHWGQGAVEITNANNNPMLSFKEDFKVAQGPDLFVYLSPNATGEDLGEFASLGPLKANEGEQEYVLPSNYKDYETVVIWCRAFSVTFATAEFDFNKEQ